jgi:hypothetical protein
MLKKEECVVEIDNPPKTVTKIERCKVLRQVTNAHLYLGNPIADEKFQMNNEINKLKRGDFGYLPSSKSYESLFKEVSLGDVALGGLAETCSESQQPEPYEYLKLKS